MRAPKSANYGFRLLRSTLHRLDSDDGWALASHLTLTGLMAIFPFLIFIASLAGFLGEELLANRVARYLFEVWPETVAEPIAREVYSVLTRPQGGVLTISILVTLYLASSGVEALRLVLNRAYRTRDLRAFWWSRMQSVAFVLVGAAALITLAFLGILGPIIWSAIEREAPWLAELRNEFVLIRLSVTTALVVLALISAHLYLPGERPRFLHIVPGIVLTLVLGTLATMGFTYYLNYYADYRSTYAGLASLVTALVYLYVLSLILVIGAELNGVLEDRRRVASDAANAG